MELQEVPPNLKTPQENEEKEIKSFWDNEVVKCLDVKAKRVTMREEWQE